MRVVHYFVLLVFVIFTICSYVRAIAEPDPNAIPPKNNNQGSIAVVDDADVEVAIDSQDHQDIESIVSVQGLFPDPNNNNNSNALDLAHKAMSLLLQLAAGGENYIVELNPDIPVQQILDHIRWLEEKLDADIGLGHLIHKFHLPPTNGTGTAFYGYSGTLSPALKYVLQGLSIIRGVDRDHIVNISESAILSDSTTSTSKTTQPIAFIQRNAPWGLSRLDKNDPPDYSDIDERTFTYNSQRGIGTDVFILDTGVRITHKDFGGRAFQPKMPGITQTTGDPNGHGTHVAGTVGSRTFGVSKGTRIVGLQVLGASGTGPWSNVIKGIEYSVLSRRQSNRPTVVNLSISGSFNQALNNALVAATRNNVHVVVAAGNDNQDACRTSPGSLGGKNSDVIVVGSTGKTDIMSGFSNFGACVDISAPGEFIQSLGNWADDSRRDMSGTSMATPHVAGALSVILSEFKTFTPAVAKKYIIDRALCKVKTTKGSTDRMLHLTPRL